MKNILSTVLFPSLHFPFSSTNFEKILYILKYPFRKGCSLRTILKTVKTAEEEQTTNCGWHVQTSSSERGLVNEMRLQRREFRITGLSRSGAGRALREHLIHSLHFPDEMKTRWMESLAQSHIQIISKSVLFSKNTTWWQMEHFFCFVLSRRTIQATFIKAPILYKAP